MTKYGPFFAPAPLCTECGAGVGPVGRLIAPNSPITSSSPISIVKMIISYSNFGGGSGGIVKMIIYYVNFDGGSGGQELGAFVM